jgi:tight adherence protein B
MGRKKNLDRIFKKYYHDLPQVPTSDEIQVNATFLSTVPALLGLSTTPLVFLLVFILALLSIWGLGWVFFGNVVMASLMVFAALFLFMTYLGSKRKAKEELFTRQLPDTLNAVANSLKAGFSLDQSFEFVSESMPEPTKSEFSRIHMKYRVGFTMAETLKELSERYPNAEVMLFVSSMVLQNQVGGNVIPFLMELGAILRERVKLKNQIAVGTSQVRLSALIIAVIPYFLLVLLHFSGYKALTETFRGFLLLMFAIAMQMVGMAIISTFMKLDI